MDQDEIENKSKQRKVIKKEVSVDLKNAEEKTPKVRTSSRNSRIPISTLRSQFLNTVQEKGLNKHQKCVVRKQATQAINPSSVVEDSKVQDNLEAPANSQIDYLGLKARSEEDNLEAPANSQIDYLGLKARSEVSIITTVSVRNEDVVVHLPTTSTGRSNKETSCITQEQVEALYNKGTMTECDDLEFAKEIRSILERRTDELIASNFKDCFMDKLYEQEFLKKSLNITFEPPLEQKFSVIKVPTWRRSWTFPVITRKVGIQSCSCLNNDNLTYVYNDGSEFDSVFLRRYELKHRLSEILQRNELMHRLSAVLRRNDVIHRLSSIDIRFITILGAVCAFLMITILMYVAFGHKIVQYFLPREEPESFISWFIDYFGGGFAYLFIGFFHTMGQFLNMPTQEGEEPRNRFRWNSHW